MKNIITYGITINLAAISIITSHALAPESHGFEEVATTTFLMSSTCSLEDSRMNPGSLLMDRFGYRPSFYLDRDATPRHHYRRPSTFFTLRS